MALLMAKMFLLVEVFLLMEVVFAVAKGVVDGRGVAGGDVAGGDVAAGGDGFVDRGVVAALADEVGDKVERWWKEVSGEAGGGARPGWRKHRLPSAVSQQKLSFHSCAVITLRNI